MGLDALTTLRIPHHAQVLIGLTDGDNAAVYQLNSDTVLVQTVDFFPLIVDDPYTYDAIVTANALSDIYTIRGKSLLALAIAALPNDLDQAVMSVRLFHGGLLRKPVPNRAIDCYSINRSVWG
ncbi:AIR synthase related protein [Chloroflexus sp.]|uniref:AIR synthase related protein n=1 Tax=Chloroflexus sp. TaxID=1904827 RepID=UPI002ADDB47E|nr:AIR synthase related protein [Chloroflexus sp.]